MSATNAVLRVIRETGEAFADYMDKEFRDLSCLRIELDEQWQYVGCHQSPDAQARSQAKVIIGFGLAWTPTRNWFSRT